MCCQQHVVETFAGGAELLRRWGRCLKARVAVSLPPAFSACRIRPAAIIALIIISSGPCNIPRRCCQMMPEGYSTSS